MPSAQRFFINDDSCIVDKLDPGPSKIGWCFHEDGPADEKKLRERVLLNRLPNLVNDLIMSSNPLENDVAYALYATICASRLNELDVALSLQARFDGKLKHKKISANEHTSLSLFCDDVEKLLRDFYGESDDQAIEKLYRAVFAIVDGFTRYLAKDLWQEHVDATAWDEMLGIGVPDGYGINGSMHRAGLIAIHDLSLRASNICASPDGVSKYTIAFAKWMASRALPNKAIPD
jgi:hypothetical protein